MVPLTDRLLLDRSIATTHPDLHQIRQGVTYPGNPMRKLSAHYVASRRLIEREEQFFAQWPALSSSPPLRIPFCATWRNLLPAGETPGSRRLRMRAYESGRVEGGFARGAARRLKSILAGWRARASRLLELEQRPIETPVILRNGKRFSDCGNNYRYRL